MDDIQTGINNAKEKIFLWEDKASLKSLTARYAEIYNLNAIEIEKNIKQNVFEKENLRAHAEKLAYYAEWLRVLKRRIISQAMAENGFALSGYDVSKPGKWTLKNHKE